MVLSVRQQNTNGLRCYAIYRDGRLVCTFAPWVSKQIVVATKTLLEKAGGLNKRIRGLKYDAIIKDDIRRVTNDMEQEFYRRNRIK